MPQPSPSAMPPLALRYAVQQGVIRRTHAAPRWHRWAAAAGLLLLGLSLGAIATTIVDRHTPQAEARR